MTGIIMQISKDPDTNSKCTKILLDHNVVGFIQEMSFFVGPDGTEQRRVRMFVNGDDYRAVNKLLQYGFSVEAVPVKLPTAAGVRVTKEDIEEVISAIVKEDAYVGE